jgi:hypothetical protein
MIVFARKHARLLAVALLVCVVAVPPRMARADSHRGRYQAGRASFAVRFKNLSCDLKVMGVYLLPREALTLEVSASAADFRMARAGGASATDLRLAAATGTPAGEFRLSAPCGTVLSHEADTWRWEAPGETGLYPIVISRAPGYGRARPDSIVLNVFVMVPYKMMHDESLSGYRIGRYPDQSSRRPPRRASPRGFIEVTRENEGTKLSPHFRLGQFLCKQSGAYPKYVVLSERLLLKLELVLERANESGYLCDTFHVMSGYRTPHYNRALGNVPNSMHLWGYAADIFIDQYPRDGVMDDLNRDGVVNVRDAAVLYDMIDRMFAERVHEPLVGGLAKYKSTRSHGPFVHVDVRGRRARW